VGAGEFRAGTRQLTRPAGLEADAQHMWPPRSGVGDQVLGRWVRLARVAALADHAGAVPDADERAELERLRRENAELRLRRENAELRLDREFLKKAAA
jgi:transposase-like protein